MKITLFRLSFLAALILWVYVANFYLSRTPPIHRSSDYDGHVHYTSIIANENRLPAPFDGWQTYHPPLYYMISSLFKPTGDDHITIIRRVSIFYGATLFCIIFWFLRKADVNKWAALGTTLYMATSPSYVLFYTHYNNDSLSILLCAAFLAISFQLFKGPWNNMLAVLLVLIGIASTYTKFTTFFLMLTLGILVVTLAIFRKIPLKKSAVYLSLMAIVGFSIIPWLMGHNAYYTGSWFPVNCYVFDGWGSVYPNALRVFFKIPGFENGQFFNPYAGLWTGNAKEHCYTLFLFSSSLFGDFDVPEAPVWLGWSLFWIHLFLSWIAVKNFYRSGYSKIALAAVVLASLAMIPFILECPHRCAMSFRYIAWTWLPWSYLFSQFLMKTPWNNSLPSLLFFRAVLVAGIVLHIDFVLHSVVF